MSDYRLSLLVGAALDASFRNTFRAASNEIKSFSTQNDNAQRSANAAAAKSAGDAAKSTQNSSRAARSELDNLGRSLTRLGTFAVGTAIIAGLTAATKASIEFDRNVRNVTSLIAGSGASAQQAQQYYEQFSKAILDLSRTVPQSANDLAKGLYEVVSNGVAAGDAVKVLGVASRAASAGLATTETAVDGITGVMNAYGYSASQAQAVSDVLFQTVNVGRFTFTQLAQQIGDVTASASAARIPIQDVGTALATLTQGGIVPAEAVTSLNRIILGLIQPSAALTKVLHNMGQESGIAAIQTLGFKGTIEGIQKATGGTITGVTNLFNDVRAQRGVFVLMAQGGELYNRTAKAMLDNNQYLGATFRALQEQQKSTGFQFDILRNKVEAAALAGFGKINPEIALFLKNINNAGGQSSTLSNVLDHTRPILASYGSYLEAIGRALETAGKDVGPFVGGLAAISGTAAAGGLNFLVGSLADLAQGLSQNAVLIDGVALLLVGKYASSLAAAAVQIVTLQGAELSMAASTRLATVGFTAQSVAAEAMAVRLAGASDAALATRAGLAGVAGFVNPLTLAVAGLGAIFFSYEQGQKSAKKAIDEVADAMGKEGDAAQRSLSGIVQSTFAHSAYQSALRPAGVETDALTKSLQGNKDAQEEVAQALIRSSPALQNSAGLQRDLRETLAGSKEAAKSLAGASPELAAFALKYKNLSDTFADGKTQADANKSALDQLNSSIGASSSEPLVLANSIKELGTDSTQSEEALKALQKANDELQKSFEKWASPAAALKDALSDSKDEASAATRAFNDSQKGNTKAQNDAVKDQKKALNAQYQNDVTALRQQKENVSNRAKGGADAINQEIDDLKRKHDADVANLDQQKATDGERKSSTKSVADDATVNLDRYIAKLKEQDDALQKFQQNLVTIASKYGTQVAKQLQDLGPEAAGLIQEFANATGTKADQARAEIERNLDLTQLSSNIEIAMNLASVAAGHGTDSIGIAAVAGLKGHTEELIAVANQYAIDLTTVADPILDQLGLKKVPIIGVLKNNPVGSRVVPKAEGGLAEEHSAEIAPGGAWRVWAEPETGGEAYIPLAASKEARSQDIWRQVGAMKGWTFAATDFFAEGGFSGFPKPPKLIDAPLAQSVQKVMDGFYEGMSSLAASGQQNAGGYGGPAGAAPKGQIVDWIHAAEAIAGWPDSFTNGLYTLIMHESGGNPSSINLWDTNATAGHPSKGLMQTIDSTFNAYAFPGHHNIYNPVDNILAGTAYALKNYGAGMVIAGGRRNKAGNYIGYAEGGIHQGTYDQGGALLPGWTMAYNGTGQTEHVLTAKHVDQIVGAIERNKGGGNTVIVQARTDSTEEIARRTARKLR